MDANLVLFPVHESKKKISRNKGDFSDGRMAKNDEKSPFLAK